ncbi:peptidylprolyl isomerase [Leptolyngbya sp. AN02str]|uniref:peptidylprolyl isomerase n=1 Tax=Leptolyngbya sp. AN02str TaxID=3423363 RepID=UPI003D31521D
MAVVLQIGNRQVDSDELMNLISGYQMLPQLLRELVIDEAIAQWEASLGKSPLSEEDEASAREQFFVQHQINSDATLQAWLRRYGIAPQRLNALATRTARIEVFKEATWGPKLESYFLSRKGQLDKVIYSLIRTQDMGIAQELYFRALETEQSFAELARTYSQGPEAQTDGLIGPVELSVPHPTLAQMLSVSQPKQLWPPTRIGEWVVIVRLERFIPAQMDDPMRRRLLNELFNTWIEEQVGSINLQPTSATLPSEPDMPSETAPDPSDDAIAVSAPSTTEP